MVEEYPLIKQSLSIKRLIHIWGFFIERIERMKNKADQIRQTTEHFRSIRFVFLGLNRIIKDQENDIHMPFLK